jgi:hypothetical protein
LQSPDEPLQVEISADVGDVVYMSGDTAGITGTDTGLVVTAVCRKSACIPRELKLSNGLEQRRVKQLVESREPLFALSPFVYGAFKKHRAETLCSLSIAVTLVQMRPSHQIDFLNQFRTRSLWPTVAKPAQPSRLYGQRAPSQASRYVDHGT